MSKKSAFKWKYLPLHRATQPRDGEALTNRWWVAHPTEGLLAMTVARDHLAPQCNRNHALADKLLKKTNLYPGHVLQFMEVTYLRHFDDSPTHNEILEVKTDADSPHTA